MSDDRLSGLRLQKFLEWKSERFMVVEMEGTKTLAERLWITLQIAGAMNVYLYIDYRVAFIWQSWFRFNDECSCSL